MKNYFPRLIGNDETKERLCRAIDAGRLPHAFLIGGPSGSGKSTLATEMAAAINCLAGDDSSSLPCGACNNCRRIYEGNFPDLKILSKKKDKATLGVEAVKDFREDMFLSSTEAEFKIYVIDNAECMTPEAQNALLKVLEEPPKSVIIILLATECDRILTTIKSRAQYIAMARFNEEEMESILLDRSDEARSMQIGDKERFKAVIMSADGRIGVAQNLLSRKSSEENFEEFTETVKIISVITQKSSYADIRGAISMLPTKRADLLVALERLMSALRDLIVVQYSQGAKTVFFPDAESTKKHCGRPSAKRLTAVYDIINEAHELCTKNANVANLLATLASKIKTGTNH